MGRILQLLRRLRLRPSGPRPSLATEIRNLADGTVERRIKACLNLTRAGAEPWQVVPALCLAAKDPSSRVRRAAVAALVRTGEPRVRHPLLQALDDQDPSVRQVAADGLRLLERRSEERHSTWIQVDYRTRGHDEQRGVVLDLSERGMLLHVASPLSIGQSLEVCFPDARRMAQVVRWDVLRRGHGCVFIDR
jgi:HEAT repeat protein